MVGWEAGVRLGARAGHGPEETPVTPSPPPSASPPDDEGGVCSKNALSSEGKVEQRMKYGEGKHYHTGEKSVTHANTFVCFVNIRVQNLKS